MKNILIAGLLAFGLTAAAFAQGAPAINIRGVVVSLDGNVLTVGAPIGTATTKITLAPNFRVQYIVKSSLAAITPGTFVGSAAQAQVDGTLRAIEIHVFPAGQTPGAGSRPYDLGPASSMTNGSVDTIGATKVDKVDAHTLLLKYDGGEKTIVVTADTPIVTYEPADASALVKGAHVNVRATKNPDGSLSSAGVNVGKDGLVPPM
ncbi:MAG TPA: hypothetical protein VN905_12625 [Candidatus Binatia bacterium]|nr:hypothetical protein [Candidatus Binatia bacterium]